MKPRHATFALLSILWSQPLLWARLPEPGRKSLEQDAGKVRSDSEEKLGQQLAETGEKIILALRGEKPSDILGLWSSTGVTVGVDGPTVSKSQARTEFESKKNLYCFLFDTRCLQKEDEQDRKKAGLDARPNSLKSYRELLLQTPCPKVETHVTRHGQSWSGQLRILVIGGQKATPDEAKSPLEFLFALEDGQWRLTAILYD
jgi:hypothetical protein